MNDYSIALFVHAAGALGFFVALGLEWTGLWHMGSTIPSDRVRTRLSIFKSARRVGFASMVTTVISGLYMVATVWGGAAWSVVSMGSLVVVVVFSLALTGPRMAAIGRALTAEYVPGAHTIGNLVKHPLLWISIQTRVTIAVAIVVLKIAKPDLGGSLLIVGVAVALGLASAVPMFSFRQLQLVLTKEVEVHNT